MGFYDRLTILQAMHPWIHDFIGFRESDLVKLNILINGEILDALS